MLQMYFFLTEEKTSLIYFCVNQSFQILLFNYLPPDSNHQKAQFTANIKLLAS